MDIEYKFSILRIQFRPIESFGDVIQQVFWRCTGSNGNVFAHYDSSCVFNLEKIDPNKFIPLKDLTDDIMINQWILPRIEYSTKLKERMKDSIERQLRDQFILINNIQ